MKTKPIVLFRTCTKGNNIEYVLRPEMAVFLAEQRKEKCFVYKMSCRPDGYFHWGGVPSKNKSAVLTLTRATKKQVVNFKSNNLFRLYLDYVYVREDLGKEVVRALDEQEAPLVIELGGWPQIHALECAIPEGLYRFKDVKRDDPALVRTVKQFPDLQELLEVVKIPADMKWEIVKLWEPDTSRNNLREAVVDTAHIIRANVSKDECYSKKEQEQIAKWQVYS